MSRRKRQPATPATSRGAARPAVGAKRRAEPAGAGRRESAGSAASSVVAGRLRPFALKLAVLLAVTALAAGYAAVRWRNADQRRAGAPAPQGGARAVAGSSARPASAPPGGPGAVPRVDNLDALDPAVAAAIRTAIAAVEQQPANGASWGGLGIVYHAHRYFALAARSYQEAARLDPVTADWPHLSGILAEERGDVEEAASWYRAALERAPADGAARYRLGNVLLQAGRVEEAAAAFDQVAAAAPGAPWGPLGLGRVALRRGSTADAARHFERAVALDPDNAQAAYLLASAYREQGRREEARRWSEPARDGVKPVGPADPILDRVRTGGRSLQNLVAAANQMLAAGDAAAAEALYAAVLGTDPDYYDALYNLGMLYGRQQLFAEAQSTLERAVAARPRSSEARMLLVLALAEQGRLDAAHAELRALLEVDPEHGVARAMLEDMER
jgi:tetratricopeptide (TPR) repeat protein